jgi:NTP pyrophosphatase (non-canonical NTP hydrolase)
MKALKVKLLAEQALKKWGEESQIDMMIEECAELVDVLQKRRRGRRSWPDVLEELVDVELMLNQMMVITEMRSFTYIYKKVKKEKLDYLKSLIEVKP